MYIFIHFTYWLFFFFICLWIFCFTYILILFTDIYISIQWVVFHDPACKSLLLPQNCALHSSIPRFISTSWFLFSLFFFCGLLMMWVWSNNNTFQSQEQFYKVNKEFQRPREDVLCPSSHIFFCSSTYWLPLKDVYWLFHVSNITAFFHHLMNGCERSWHLRHLQLLLTSVPINKTGLHQFFSSKSKLYGFVSQELNSVAVTKLPFGNDPWSMLRIYLVLPAKQAGVKIIPESILKI